MRTLLINGSVWAGIGQLTDALLIKDGRVLALGSDALSASADKTIDLAGSFVMPAFADGHAHPLFAGRESQGPKVNGLQSVAEIVAEVKGLARLHRATNKVFRERRKLLIKSGIIAPVDLPQ